MAQLIQHLLKLRREKVLIKRLLYVVVSSLSARCMHLSVFCMHHGMVVLSCWLAKIHCRLAKDTKIKSEEVGVYRYQSVASYIDSHASGLLVYPERMVTLHPVRRVGFKYKRPDLHSRNHHVTFPTVSFYTLQQVEVIGGSEMVFTREGSLLYDELALGDVKRYGTKVFSIVPHTNLPPYLPAASKEYVLCKYSRYSQSTEVVCAISLLKDYSRNYYHWLLECLPRAILALRQPDWADAPLLLDANLPAQHIESLRLLSPTSKHIIVSEGLRLPIQMLYFPSVLSYTHDYYATSPRAEDFLIAPEAITLLRESFLPKTPSCASEQNKQLVYVARRRGTNRSILNDQEVINTLVELGFSIVYPENLSFPEQIALFSNAKIIVGPSGAGMANIVFARPDCKIAILAPVTYSANFYFFSQIAQYLNQQIVYVGGKPIEPSDVHSQYQINVHVLQKLITEYLHSSYEVNKMPASNK